VEMLLLDMPLIIASFWSISAFYLMAHRELFGKNWKRGIVLLPALMASGIALTIINTKAVLEAILGVETAFARTAKYGSLAAAGKAKLKGAKYRRRSGWLPYAELACGTYFVGMVAYALDTFNYLTIPFLLLFVSGYYWAGFTTLYQEYQGRLLWQKQRQAVLEFENSAT